jgi:penicillin G amidase
MMPERRSIAASMLWGVIIFGAPASSTVQIPESRALVKGLSARAEILIDRWGVPHIYARTRGDAFFAQGWNAARDRLWQIDLWRRSGLGELAAALGPTYIEQDRAIRLFVYRGDWNREWSAYGPDAKRYTEAFVAGINAYVDAVRSNATLLPVEFKLAGYAPAFWKAEDVVRIRHLGLAGSAFAQVRRAHIACHTGHVSSAEVLYKIDPPWTAVIPQGLDLCSIPADVLDVYQLAQKAVSFEPPQGQVATTRAAQSTGEDAIEGSNNWVIAPKKSATGRPILANDPHRSFKVPSLRYLAHLVAPGLNVIGAGEPALPGIAIGHNEQIAFGLTVFFIAQEDLYVYETNPRDPNQYRYGGAWEPMQIVRESVAVRGGAPVEAELKFTRHGPVVRQDPASHRAYVLRAAWLEPGGAPYFGAMRYLRAKNMEEFAAALKHWGTPGENHVYADTSGRIGWFPAGFTPVRRNSDGLLPLPGDGRYEWDGYWDRNLLPSEIDPARGYIATANQMNLPKGYPYAERRISFSWASDTRFERISHVLDGLPKVSMQDSAKLQNDVLNLQALRLIDLLETMTPSDTNLRDTIQWLKNWDGQVRAESPQAALYQLWWAHHLVPAVLARIVPPLPESARAFSGMAVPEPILALLEHPDERLGCEPESARDELMMSSLAKALGDAQKRLGADRTSWQWGKLASALFEHPLSALADEASKLKMNVGPAPKSGDGSVVGMAAFRNQDFRTQAGASFRMILDVGRWDESVAVNTPGQSGDPASVHYRDLFPLWLEGKYFPLVYSRSAVTQATRHRIVLQPR